MDGQSPAGGRATGDAAAAKFAAARQALAAVMRNHDLRAVQLAWSGCITAEWAQSVALAVVAFRAGGVLAVGAVGLLRTLPAAVLNPSPPPSRIGCRASQEARSSRPSATPMSPLRHRSGACSRRRRRACCVRGSALVGSVLTALACPASNRRQRSNVARHLNADSERLYALHRRWLVDVVGPGDSLLTPGNAIWAVEHLLELEQHFVENPDLAKGKRFLEKLHDQLAPVSPEAVQLMAELHVVHFLIVWTGAISAAKKVSDLEAILSWMPVPARLPEDVAAAMSPGLVHPGQWVMTRRDTQLTWLIGFALAWKNEPEERRQVMIDDPWALKAFTTPMQVGSAEGARLALLHLAHPDTFEAIVSPDHRHLIVERFREIAAGEEDTDRGLLAIRGSLTMQYGDRFDWYGDPLFRRWWKSRKEWAAFLEWLQRFRDLPEFDAWERTYKLKVAEKVRSARELILADDHAWYDALRDAVTDKENNLTLWRNHATFLTWAGSDRNDAAQALKTLWAGDHPVQPRLQAFLDQVPGTVLGPLGERLNISSFLLMGEDPHAYPPVKIGVLRKAWDLTRWGSGPDQATEHEVYDRFLVFLEELVLGSRSWDDPLRDPLDAQSAMWALVKTTSKPESWEDRTWREFVAYRDGAASEVAADEDVENDVAAGDRSDGEQVALVDHIAAAAKDLRVDRAILDEIVELLEDKRQVVLYGPPGTGKTYLGLRLAKAIAQDDPARISLVQFHPATSYEDFFEGLRPKVTEAGQVTYERTDGPLVAIADAAAADPTHTYVLLIDEINRANLPKVFGELLFLLEYRSESARTLYRPEKPFSLPNNLWLIGTMNTADRSVALIDAAMRRRFHFVPFFPHHGPMKGLLRRWLEDGGGRLGVADLLDAVNAELLGLVGEHLLIGPSHFMKTDLSDRALERIWTYNVFPLIEEQFWGNEQEIARWRWDVVRRRFEPALTNQVAEVLAGQTIRDDGDEPADA